MYKGYVALLDKYPGKFEIVAFPCNQFGSQEPGTLDEIKAFAREKYGFKGMLMDKVDVNGKNAHPLWMWMQNKIAGIMGTTSIKWNFSKFLADKDGNLIARYGPQDKVDKIEKDLLKLIE